MTAEARIFEAHCLCGAVSARGRSAAPEIHACHCEMCQRWTGGGPFMWVDLDDIEIEGLENTRTYASSDFGERVHCAICGSPIYWKVKGQPTECLALGMLDDQSGLKVTREIFVEYRAPWAAPCEGAEQRTEEDEAELKAEFEELARD